MFGFYLIDMKKRNNAQLKIIAATSMTIFSLAAVFIATTAWFTVSRKVDANGDAFEVTAYDGLVKKITAHKLSSSENGNRTYSEDAILTYMVDSKTGSVTRTGETTSMGLYDSLQSNRVFSFLYVITFDANVAKNRENSIRIVPSTSTTEKNSLLNKNIESTDNPMSSILTFSYGESTEKSSGFSMTFDDETEHEEFLTTAPSYRQTLSGMSIDPSSIQNEDEYYAFVYVSYEISNIEYIYALNLGSDVLNGIGSTNYITYRQDWKISIS